MYLDFKQRTSKKLIEDPKKALVIGAGGVAPSVVLSVQKSGITNISIANRTYENVFFKKI